MKVVTYYFCITPNTRKCFILKLLPRKGAQGLYLDKNDAKLTSSIMLKHTTQQEAHLHYHIVIPAQDVIR